MKETKTFYFVDMGLDICECPMGISKGSSKLKHVLAKQYNIASFLTIPADSAEMRAFYHFLGTGKREDASWYRSLN